jgi:hypothetical protein
MRTTPTMGPGQFVEYGALFEGVDPNTKGFPDSAFRAYLMIDVLLNPMTLATPGPDTGLFPGGTFVRQRLATTEPARLRSRSEDSRRSPTRTDFCGYPTSKPKNSHPSRSTTSKLLRWFPGWVTRH